MDPQERRPPQRHSSLPASLHRLMVSGPPEPEQDPNADDMGVISPRRGEVGGGIAVGGVPGPVHPVPGAEQQLPSLILTQVAFEGTGGAAPSTSRHPSRSPALSDVGQASAAAVPAAAATTATLPLPPFRAQHGLRTDPAYYVSTSLPSTYTIPPPGPHLRPISWSPGSRVGSPPTAARVGSPDRSVPPPPRTGRHPSPIPVPSSIPVVPPSPPVAGPSRLPEESPARGRKRKARPKKGPEPHEAISAGRSVSGGRRRQQHASDSERDFGSSGARAPSTGLPAGGGEASQRVPRRAASTRRAEPGPSSRRVSESGRGSPASSTAESWQLAVGSTAYSVTTLSPLRPTILPPVVSPVPAPEGGASAPTPPAVAAAGPSRAREAEGGGGDGKEVKRSESDTEGEPGGKRARRARSEQQESTTSSSSEHAQAPKSKKTLIACNFCRVRKLRCDGQKPYCANCRKRGNACEYAQQPKRRGPGKTPRGTSTKRRARQTTAGGGADPARAAETAMASGSGIGSGGASTSAAGAPGPEAAGPSNAEVAPAGASPSVSGPATGAGAAAAPVAVAGGAQAGLLPQLAMTRQAFEPQLTGPVPTYPGFAYRPPSAASSSYSAGQLPPFHSYSVGRGMSRSVASDSVRSSNTSNVSSAPSVPDSEEGAEGSVAEEFMDYTELEDFYRPPQPRPGRGEDGSQ